MRERPIGYWVKLLDRLIDESFDSVLGDTGLGRRHWQLLNVVGAEPTSRADIDRALAPFRAERTRRDRPGAYRDRTDPRDDQPDVGITAALDDLHRLGWARATPDGRWALTAAGTAAAETLRERVIAQRRRIADGVSPEAYQTTLATLTRMCANLDPAAADRPTHM